MSGLLFPPIPFQQWHKTYDALHQYARVIALVRRTLTPPLPHWYHASLRVAANGLTTTPVPCGAKTFEILLDLTRGAVVIDTSCGERAQVALHGQTVSEFLTELLDALASLEIRPTLDDKQFREDTAPREYDPSYITPFWQALSQVDIVMKKFKGELRENTGPVQFWSHHFDLALLWFSGRMVQDMNPNDEESSDEQLNFGFCAGDYGIPAPYFYVSAYPLPGGWVGAPLPQGAYWHSAGWNGAVLLYEKLSASSDPSDLLLTFFRMAQRAGARAMDRE